jgi:hypothetical protein
MGINIFTFSLHDNFDTSRAYFRGEQEMLPGYAGSDNRKMSGGG